MATIGEIAARTGLTRRALRLYERTGLLQPGRSDNNYRDYREQDLRVALIVRDLRAGGLSMSAIQKLFAIKSSNREPNARIAAAHEVLLDMRAELLAQQAAIQSALDYVSNELEELDTWQQSQPSPTDS